jgi:hypothetical protein
MSRRNWLLLGFVAAEFSLCGLMVYAWGWKALGVAVVMCVTVGIRREVEKMRP